MTVRAFNATTDTIHHDVGGLSGMTHGTIAAILKPNTVASDGSHWVAGLHTSGGSFRAALMGRGVDRLTTFTNDISQGPVGFLTSTAWHLAVMRKASGTAAPRISVYDFTAETWQHDVGNNAINNSTAPGAGGTIRTEVEGSERWGGRLAVRAVWANALPWAADTDGDAAIEAAGLELLLEHWVTAAPDALWAFNQESTSDPCDDLVGTSDQTSLSGTTVITDDDPPGFFFEEPPVEDAEIEADFSMDVALAAEIDNGEETVFVAAVREFDGDDDTIHHDVGELASMTFGTAAVIVKPATVTGSHQFAGLHTSGGTLRAGLVMQSAAGVSMFSGGDFSQLADAFVINSWRLIVARKATGSAAPRFSVYNFDAGTWQHGNGHLALPDWSSPGSGGTLRTDDEGGDLLHGRIAIRAIWANEVHWAADSGGDAAIEAAGLHQLLDNWFAAEPTVLHLFNQESPDDPCDDLIDGADEVSLTGTTVIDDDQPPGFFLEEPPEHHIEVEYPFELTLDAETSAAEAEPGTISANLPVTLTLAAQTVQGPVPHVLSVNLPVVVRLAAAVNELPGGRPLLAATGTDRRTLVATGVHP